MATTRTIGPLHLEDLEPHRFEDLIRQLLYDFRAWRSLEATGRSGADGGFDARATEIVAGEFVERDGVEEDEVESEAVRERVWLVQCKREKAIGRQKLVGYLDDIAEPVGLYGIVFAAACDFSKAARDAFRNRVRELGFDEAHLWGKAEIEDQLFQPKNDHLLFAYFGISLQTRRRTIKTEVRARLATKRKALRVLKGHLQRPVLLRDATDDRYPWMDDDETKPPFERRRWIVMSYAGAFSDGLRFILHRHPAYVSDDGEEWDFAEKFDSAPVQWRENPWSLAADDLDELRSETFDVMDALPEKNRFTLIEYAILPFESILDIDENGDDWFEPPHIYTTEFCTKSEPFCGFVEVFEPYNSFGRSSVIDRMILRMDGKPVYRDLEKRVKKFRRRDE